MPNPDGTPTIQEQIDQAIAPYKDKASQYDQSQDQQTALNTQIQSIYGGEADKRAEGVENYMDRLRGNLDKNVAKADIYNQQAGRERGISQARAGLSGTDTSANDEQSRRNAIYGAAGINEAAQRDALKDYGKGVGNIIGGINKIEQQAEAKRIASMPVPTMPDESGGFIDTVFGWL